MHKVHLVSSAFEGSSFDTITHACTAWAQELGVRLEVVSNIVAHFREAADGPTLCHLPPSFTMDGRTRNPCARLARGSVRVFERLLTIPSAIDDLGAEEIIHGRGLKSFKWGLRSIASSLQANRVAIRYGCHSDQHAVLYYPWGAVDASLPILALVHGGFWGSTVGRDHTAPLSLSLAARGFCVFNIEFRRCHGDGDSWSDSIADVCRAITHLASLPNRMGLNASRVGVIGHSSGAQIAHTAISHGRLQFWACGINIVGLASLAGILDLALARDEHLGGDAVPAVLSRLRDEQLQTYCPLRQTLCTAALLVHGETDDVVPIKYSLRYLNQARANDAELLRVPGVDHMGMLKPEGSHWDTVTEWFRVRASEIPG